MYGMLIIRKAFWFIFTVVPTNDKTTDNNTNHPGACIIIDSPQPQITLMTGGGTLRVSYPKLGGTTDRQTDERIVCMYVCMYFQLWLSVVSFNIKLSFIIFFGGEVDELTAP